MNDDFKRFRHEVSAMRDEIRLKVHLAGMELKTEWEKLEPQLERVSSSATLVTSEMMSDLKTRIAEFKRRMEKH